MPPPSTPPADPGDHHAHGDSGDRADPGTRDGRDGAGARRRRLTALGIGAAVVALLAAVALTSGTGGKGGDAGRSAATRPSGRATASPSAVPTIRGPRPPGLDETLMLGRPDAPVMIVEFGDFQCPNCGRYARDIKPVLVRKYVGTGVVRMAWRDYPTFGRQSTEAAVAARAAARQGRFWQFHDALYGRRLRPRSGRLTRSYLRGVAKEAGADLTRYDTDVRDDTLRESVDRDFEFGQGLGVPGTPAFLINGTPFFGAQPLAAFERAIAQARAEQ